MCPGSLDNQQLTIKGDLVVFFFGGFKARSVIPGGGFQYFLMFTPNLGEMIQFDEHIFQMG